MVHVPEALDSHGSAQQCLPLSAIKRIFLSSRASGAAECLDGVIVNLAVVSELSPGDHRGHAHHLFSPSHPASEPRLEPLRKHHHHQ